jgi:hypothetical protein
MNETLVDSVRTRISAPTERERERERESFALFVEAVTA